MENKVYIKKVVVTIIGAFFFVTSFAQSSRSIVQAASAKILNTWYESPHEGADGNVVYLRNRYIPVPGIDRQEEFFRMLVINSDGTIIKTQYCGYCPDRKVEEIKGNYEVLQQGDDITSLKISFPNNNSDTFFKVISCTENKLVLNFQQATNTK